MSFVNHVISAALLVVILSSCRASNLGLQDSWDTYRNPRYGFEFPYPSNWISSPIPDNRDGRVFRNPQNPSAEIRGWAANKLSPVELSLLPSKTKDSPTFQQDNFTTKQGLKGKLRVKIGSVTSMMTLTLSQGEILYNWQGQCNSEQFADYYRFFSYVASQYHLPPQP